MSGVDLEGKDVSSDKAYEKVIAAKAQVRELQREVKALRKDREELLEEYSDAQNTRNVPKSPKGKRKTLDSTCRVAVGDVHGMRMDRKAVRAFLMDLTILEPEVIVLGGDISDCDGWLAKHQPVGFVPDTDYSYQEDVRAANWFLDEVQKAAPRARIEYIEGNHEDRVERWIIDQVRSHERDARFLHSLIHPKTLLRLDERGISYYGRHDIHVEGCPRGWIKHGNMYYTHELGKGKNAARSSVGQAAANVTYFHTHRRDVGVRVFPGVGMCAAYNPGCMCTMQPVYQNSNPTDWTQGYQVDFVSKDNFQPVQVPIWRGDSLARIMIDRLA